MRKKNGGIGIIPIETQSRAIFAKFVCLTLSNNYSTHWAFIAQNLLSHHLKNTIKNKNRIFSHPSILLANKDIRPSLKKIPRLWKYFIECWDLFKGKHTENYEDWSIQEILSSPIYNQILIKGDEIINFTPKLTRNYTSKSETPLFANTNDWDNIKETVKPRWEQIHNLNIEPKKKSLLWRVLHNAIYTNKLFNIINIKNSAYCSLYKDKIETSSHIFYSCKRANDYWNLVKEFFNITKKDNIEITIGKRDIIQGLESLKNTIHKHLFVLTLAL
ncbi:hypothetical protein BB560_004474 [Smittium megazygosporum]|uniref:Reverse transcriptase zinc-binding domain-containing protein n=1 Tax=Smittium megazygosporum TaxID=133381 RepID=A0A2T9Z941_9FUNG|nr:hypothetical protein BB560_004474 [Smittium megazygosporum]